MKKQLSQLMPTLVVLILILALTVTTYNISLKQEEEECWNRLENASEAIIQSIQSRVNDDLNYLRLIGKDFSNEDHLPTYEEYRDRFAAFEDVSLFERVDLLMKNNTLYTMHGDVQQIYSNDFLILNSTAEYMDLVHTDTLTNERSVNYYVPILQNDSVVAYLVGVIQCDALDEKFYTPILNGKTHNLIIDTTDGQVVMDNKNMNIDNIASDTDFKLLASKKNVVKAINSLKSGVVTFKKGNINQYLIYKPVKIYNWELLITVSENVAFASTLMLKQNHMIMVICEIVILLLYCGFYIKKVRRISLKSHELSEDLNVSNTLIQCVRILSNSADQKRSIDEILQIICEFYQAQRCYVLDLDMDNKKTNGIYEYGKQYDDIHVENMVRLCLEHMDLVNQFFENQKSYYIDDVTNEISVTSPIYSSFIQQKIHSIIVVPFMDDKQINGVFAVDNPKQNYYQKDFLESLCFFIKTAMAREKEKAKLKNLSYVASLTYAQNRNHFNEYIEQNRNKELHSLGVIYLDLNGLKEVNDKMGHIAGDTLIITASYVLQEIFLDNSYRVGGDEFVVIEQDVSELLFFDQYSKLLNRMKELEISVATGCVWKEACINLSEILQEADQKMYEDKKHYYSLVENDRRKR
ncbi:diguanylate cyclase [Holdemanella biformis]|uniref:diguanylate cyclase domain-containing protein n=1 Tax=Holdemanella biformis TaxID=1735 RepID=UPI001C279500|nr:diguanylate cyclase [Holdemanella biformis]MBU9896904.1 diguanylate cyclase [Holdemanella biformis]MBV3417994.1 diguanylate cyclase [Holdemanella biformis]